MEIIRTNNESNLTTKAYSAIREKIVTGQLKQGDVISITSLAEALNISRTPVTNACQRLEMDKFLTVIPKQGVIINTITIDDAREIYELRAAIETYSAKRAFDYITNSDIQVLKESNLKQTEFMKRNDVYAFMTEDIKFHKFLLSKYKNSQFFSILSNLYDRAFLIGIKSCSNTARMQSSLKEHEDIIQSLLDHKKDTFIDSVEVNIINGYINLTGSYKF